MDIKVHAIHFKADQKLITFIEEKLSKLELFFDQIVVCEVFLRLDPSTDKENKTTEIKILIPGKELFAKKQCKSFEEATDICVDALASQIKKHKAKLAS